MSLPKDTDTLITLKVDISNTAGTGDLIKIDPLNAEGSGQSSGTTIKSGATTGVAGVSVQ